MLTKPNCPVIALEEHYLDEEIASHFTGLETRRAPDMEKRLLDLGELRLKEMDEARIDVQVLSHQAPSSQKLPADVAVAVTRRANDRLAATIAAHPARFAGFAALPTADSEAAADELERSVTELGFKGAMIHGLADGVFVDANASGRSLPAPKNSTCRSTCIPPCRTRRSWMPTTRITRRTSPW